MRLCEHRFPVLTVPVPRPVDILWMMPGNRYSVDLCIRSLWIQDEFWPKGLTTDRAVSIEEDA